MNQPGAPAAAAPIDDAARTRLTALLTRPGVAKLLEALNGDGEETRIVGGAVRNALMDRPVSDIDCATTALPQEVMRRASQAGFKPVPTGIEHGTITVVVDGTPFEVTTLREDVETDGRHAVVRFGRDFEADAQRRDFTMNALLVDRAAEVHDLTGGLADLAAERVRFIGDPATRIAEDYLRILRFFRFHAEYGTGDFDAAGFNAVIAGRHGLAQLSRERVRGEILKLVAARRGAEICAHVAQTGLLINMLGGLMEFARLDRAAQAGFEPVHRLAALAVRVQEDAERLRERLRLSNAEHRALADYAAVLEHLGSLATPLAPAELDKLAYRHGLTATLNALNVLDQPERPAMQDDARTRHADLASGRATIPTFPISGKHLMDSGLSAGPGLGIALAQAEAMWLEAGMPGEVAGIVRRVVGEGEV